MSGLAYALAGGIGGLGDHFLKQAEEQKEKAREQRRAALRREERADDRAYRERWRDEGRRYDEGQRQKAINRGASALTKGIDFERASYVRDRFVEMGYPPHVADGMVGNILQESGGGIDTGAVGDNGNAFGMAQWNGPRRRAYLDFAKQKGVDPTDLDTQIEYLDHEMRTSESAAYDALMKTTTAEEAARVASEKFWRPGIPHVERRMAYARQLAEVASDPSMPAAARSRASDALESLQGTPKEKKDSKVKSISASMSNRIDDWSESEGVPPAVARQFKLEVERLINAEGISETAAWDKALATANRTADETRTEGGFFGLGESETVVPGTYDGTFRTAEAGTGIDAVAGPRRTATPTPDVPADPAAPGVNQREAIQQAQDAIARGADRNAVIQRLIEMGIDPEGL